MNKKENSNNKSIFNTIKRTQIKRQLENFNPAKLAGIKEGNPIDDSLLLLIEKIGEPFKIFRLSEKDELFFSTHYTTIEGIRFLFLVHQWYMA